VLWKTLVSALERCRDPHMCGLIANMFTLGAASSARLQVGGQKLLTPVTMSPAHITMEPIGMTINIKHYRLSAEEVGTAT
jgi:hypothetical protein